MPPSQLKALKAKLREQGVVGPQQSKKQRKQNAQNGANKDKRFSKKDALEGIREHFNPFEFQKAGGKAPKFEVTSMEGRKPKGVLRPGVKKSMEQEMRNASITEEYYNRNKVGGLVDRRFGENDPSMAPEDKMLERYTRAQQKSKGKTSAFDLEDDVIPGELTHMGKSLSFDGPPLKDDYEDDDGGLSDEEERNARKRRRQEFIEDGEGTTGGGEDENQPERKKSKQEVMKELITKSKFHKYERQQAKEDDDDLREELDKEMTNIHDLLRGYKPKALPAQIEPQAGMNPDRLALLNGADKAKIEKDYDIRLRQLAQDQRSKPSEKSKTEEEIVQERARKLQELEAKKQRRMQGAVESEDEEEEEENNADMEVDDMEEEDFGLGKGIKAQAKRPTMAELGVEDEDDFYIEDDLIASGSELDDSDAESPDEDEESNVGVEDEEDEEFLNGLLTKEDAQRPEFLTGANAPIQEVEDLANNGVNGDLPFTFECAETHADLLRILKDVMIADLPTVIQRIRTIYDPKLKSDNKAKLGKFAVALVDHISHLANQEEKPPFSVLEMTIRHIHSMAKAYAPEIANAFRRHLNEIRDTRSVALTPGDLVLFTAVGTIFSTSDHFHQVVTPTILTMSRYLGLKIPQTLSDLATGTYVSTLCIEYQRLSKRYVPEVVNFLENSICVLAPKALTKIPGNFPYHEPRTSFRIKSPDKPGRKLAFYDVVSTDASSEEETQLKIALLEANMHLLSVASDTWSSSPAFIEIFTPVLRLLKHLDSDACKTKLPSSTQKQISTLSTRLKIQLSTTLLARRPLELHHHKPLAIKTSIPKFEESFNPDRHYDPDKERTEAAKLAKEYKREHKGAVRSLRKDARIDAVRALKDKRERDEKYEKNQRRLMAMIQGEEGKEKNDYERERKWRKGKK